MHQELLLNLDSTRPMQSSSRPLGVFIDSNVIKLSKEVRNQMLEDSEERHLDDIIPHYRKR